MPDAVSEPAVLPIDRDPFVPDGETTPESGHHRHSEGGDPTLEAVITGANAAALLVQEGRARIVHVGDSIAQRRVTEIGANEILFSDGSVLRLQSGFL